jgi:hypothetical protein
LEENAASGWKIYRIQLEKAAHPVGKGLSHPAGRGIAPGWKKYRTRLEIFAL